MNLKKKLSEIKSQIKPYIPVLIAVSATCAAVAAASAAFVYRKQYLKSIELDLDDWPVIEVAPTLFKEMKENGAILKVQFEGNVTHLWTDEEVPETNIKTLDGV